MNIIDLRRCLFKVADQVGPLIRLNNFNKGGSTQAIHVDGKILIALLINFLIISSSSSGSFHKFYLLFYIQKVPLRGSISRVHEPRVG